MLFSFVFKFYPSLALIALIGKQIYRQIALIQAVLILNMLINMSVIFL